MYILPNISRSERNQALKFCQLKDITWETFVFGKIIWKDGMAKLFPDSFLKKNKNWTYLWINSLKSYTVCFYYMPGWGLSIYIKTKLQTTCLYLIYSFCKKKRRSGTSFPASFSVWFFKKNISLILFINWPNAIVWLSLLYEILGIIWIVNVCKSGCDVISFETGLKFLIKSFFLYDQKVERKN